MNTKKRVVENLVKNKQDKDIQILEGITAGQLATLTQTIKKQIGSKEATLIIVR